ncbi:hypothetical protein P9112_014068 [Eukaryota sp. TZLM1-RC]
MYGTVENSAPRIADQRTLWFRQYRALLKLKSTCIGRDKKYLANSVLTSLYYTAIVIAIVLFLVPQLEDLLSERTDPMRFNLGPEDIPSYEHEQINPFVAPSLGDPVGELNEVSQSGLLGSIPHNLNDDGKPIPSFYEFLDEQSVDEHLFNTSSFNKPSSATYAYLFDAYTSTELNLTMMYSPAMNSFPVGLNSIISAYVNEQLPTTIHASRQDMPLPPFALDFSLLALMGSAYLLTMGFVNMIPLFAEMIVKDKETGIKNLMTCHGLKRSVYWLSSASVDAIVFGILIVFTILLMVVTKIPFVVDAPLIASVLPMLLSVFHTIGYGYLFSFIFSKVETATKVLRNVIPLVMLVPILLLRVAPLEGTLHNVLSIILLIVVPPYGLNRCLEVIALNLQEKDTMTLSDVFSGDLQNGQLIPMLFLVMHGILGCLLPWFVDYISRNKGRKGGKNQEALLNEIASPFDSDVASEMQSTRSTSSNKSADPNSIVIHKLVKVFKSKGKNKKEFTAVNGLCLKVSPGEIVSLLGPNGCGKTTTCSIITGDLFLSAGSLHVFGHDVRTDMDEIHKSLGVCPQKDTLFELLSVREHLELFAAIVGIPSHLADKRVDHIVSRFQLGEYVGRRSAALSGGYKRRLQLSLACIGAPRLLLLDEPSSAMSVEARRALWELIKQEQKRGCATILTTHSMPEAEVLSDRIAIMTRGRLRCVGSPQRLKSLYGQGWKVFLNINNTAQRAQVLDFCKSIHSQAKIASFIPGKFAQVDLPSDVVLSRVFNSFENVQGNKEVGIVDYAITMTTLEHVFIKFAKLSQEEEDRANEKESLEEKNNTEEKTKKCWLF